MMMQSLLSISLCVAQLSFLNTCTRSAEVPVSMAIHNLALRAPVDVFGVFSLTQDGDLRPMVIRGSD